MTIAFFLHPQKKGSDGLWSIYMRVSHNSTQKLLSCGARMKCQRQSWNIKKQCVIGINPEANDINEELSRLQSQYKDAFWKLRREKGDTKFSVKEIIAEVRQENPTAFMPKNIDDAYRVFLKKTTRRLSAGSSVIYTRLQGHLHEFGRIYGKVNFSHVDYNYVPSFAEFLFEGGAFGKPNSINTVNGMISRLNGFFEYSHRKGWLRSDEAFGQAIVAPIDTEKVSLTKEEVAMLYAAKIENQLISNIRDVFVFSCKTGPRVSDGGKVKAGYVNYDSDLGIHTLKYSAKKNKRVIEVPMDSVALEIFNKHGNFGFVEKVHSSRLTSHIREACRIAGINSPTKKLTFKGGIRKEEIVEKWELITFHVSRATFITTLLVDGYSESDVALLAGITLSTISRYHRPSREQLFKIEAK